MLIVKYRKYFYAFTVLLTVASIAALAIWGLQLGIDFKGGSILEVEYPETRPQVEEVKTIIDPIVADATVRPIGDKGYLLRMREVTENERAQITSQLTAADANLKVNRFDSIGPVLGSEAATKSLWSIGIVLLAIVLFVSYAFRHVSKPVASWKYGLATVNSCRSICVSRTLRWSRS